MLVYTTTATEQYTGHSMTINRVRDMWSQCGTFPQGSCAGGLALARGAIMGCLDDEGSYPGIGLTTHGFIIEWAMGRYGRPGDRSK